MRTRKVERTKDGALDCMQHRNVYAYLLTCIYMCMYVCTYKYKYMYMSQKTR